MAYVTLNKQEDADLLLPSGFLNPHQNITPFEDVSIVIARPWGSYNTGRTIPEQCGWSVYCLPHQILDVLLIETIKTLLIETIRHDKYR